MVWDCSGALRVDELGALVGVGGRIVYSAGIRGHQDIETGVLYWRDFSLHGFAISNASVAERDNDTLDAAAGIEPETDQ